MSRRCFSNATGAIGNRSYLTQQGEEGVASVAQTGSDNESVAVQGAPNRVTELQRLAVTQDGTDNFSDVKQFGSQNDAVVSQTGSGNNSLVNQPGFDNAAGGFDGAGDVVSAGIVQDGTNNSSTLTQTANENSKLYTDSYVCSRKSFIQLNLVF